MHPSVYLIRTECVHTNILLVPTYAIYSIGGQSFWMTFDTGSSDLVRLPLPSLDIIMHLAMLFHFTVGRFRRLHQSGLPGRHEIFVLII